MNNSDKNACIRCKGQSQLKCSRCGGDYCSTICQEIDWLRHCFVCCPKPALIAIEAKHDKTVKPKQDQEQNSTTGIKKLYQMIKSMDLSESSKSMKDQKTRITTETHTSVMSMPKALPLGKAKRIFKTPFEQKVLPIGKQRVQIFILDTSYLKEGYVAGIRKDKMKDLNAIQLFLSRLEQPTTPYVPMRDEYVLAKFSDQWYRGKVIDCSADNTTFQILYVDYLNDEWVTSKDIQSYPAELANDCNTNLLLLDDLPEEITPTIVDTLEKEIQNDRNLIINQIDKYLEENVVVVQSQEMGRILKSAI